MNKRLIIIILSSVVLLGIVILTVLRVPALNKGTIDLATIPRDATVVVDGGKSTKMGKLNLVPGEHDIVVSRNGFETKTTKVTVKQNESTTQTIVLVANTQVGLDYLTDHPDEVAAMEGITGATVDAKGEIITDKNPLIQLLPYTGSDYSIDVGVSKAHPNDDTAIGIYITSSSDAGNQRALNWIKAQGYNPADYEIIYDRAGE